MRNWKAFKCKRLQKCKVRVRREGIRFMLTALPYEGLTERIKITKTNWMSQQIDSVSTEVHKVISCPKQKWRKKGRTSK